MPGSATRRHLHVSPACGAGRFFSSHSVRPPSRSAGVAAFSLALPRRLVRVPGRQLQQQPLRRHRYRLIRYPDDVVLIRPALPLVLHRRHRIRHPSRVSAHCAPCRRCTAQSPCQRRGRSCRRRARLYSWPSGANAPQVHRLQLFRVGELGHQLPVFAPLLPAAPSPRAAHAPSWRRRAQSYRCAHPAAQRRPSAPGSSAASAPPPASPSPAPNPFASSGSGTRAQHRRRSHAAHPSKTYGRETSQSSTPTKLFASPQSCSMEEVYARRRKKYADRDTPPALVDASNIRRTARGQPH